jgi:hypothetical protein
LPSQGAWIRSQRRGATAAGLGTREGGYRRGTWEEGEAVSVGHGRRSHRRLCLHGAREEGGAADVGHGRRNCRRLDQMMAFLAKLADEPDVVLHVLFTWTS